MARISYLTHKESVDLNEFLREVCDNVIDYPHAFGGKSVPYIGWFWRYVNFQEPFMLGVIPTDSPHNVITDLIVKRNKKPVAGFLQANKWDYPVYKPDPHAVLLIISYYWSAKETDQPGERSRFLKAANEIIQNSIPEKYRAQNPALRDSL